MDDQLKNLDLSEGLLPFLEDSEPHNLEEACLAASEPLLPSSWNYRISENLLLDSLPPQPLGGPEGPLSSGIQVLFCAIYSPGREGTQERRSGSFSSNLPSPGPSPQRCPWPGLSELRSPAGKSALWLLRPGLSLEKPSTLVLWWRVCMRAFHRFCLPRRSQVRQRLGAYPSSVALRLRGRTSPCCIPAWGLVVVTASGSASTCEQIQSLSTPPPSPHPLTSRVSLTQTGTICRQCRQQGEHQASSEP